MDSFLKNKQQEENDGGNAFENTEKSTGKEKPMTFDQTMADHSAERYWENHSTMSDLAYNHFPKHYQGESIEHHLGTKSERHEEPEDLYLKNFGNITRSGHVEQKREQWKKEGTDADNSDLTGTTVNDDTYTWPDAKLKQPKYGKGCNQESG